MGRGGLPWLLPPGACPGMALERRAHTVGRGWAGAEPEVLDPAQEQVPRYLPALLFALATD